MFNLGVTPGTSQFQMGDRVAPGVHCPEQIELRTIYKMISLLPKKIFVVSAPVERELLQYQGMWERRLEDHGFH